MALIYGGFPKLGILVPIPPLVSTYCFFTVSSTGERQICHHPSIDLPEAPPALSPHLATASKSHGRFKGPINRSMLLDFKDATYSNIRYAISQIHTHRESQPTILIARASPVIIKIKPFTFLGWWPVRSVNYVRNTPGTVLKNLLKVQFGAVSFFGGIEVWCIGAFKRSKSRQC